MHNIFESKQITDIGIKKITMEGLILIIERYPGTIKKHDDLKQKFINMIFYFMVEQEEEIDEKWQNPPEGFRPSFQNDEEESNLNVGINFIDRLMECVESEYILPIVSTTI